MADPKEVAKNALILLQQDPRRYRNFGVYWYFIKALMKRYYSRDQLYLLGDYDDPDAASRMPDVPADEVLTAALEEYGQNARYDPFPKRVHDHEGDLYELFDEDAGI